MKKFAFSLLTTALLSGGACTQPAPGDGGTTAGERPGSGGRPASGGAGGSSSSTGTGGATVTGGSTGAASGGASGGGSSSGGSPGETGSGGSPAAAGGATGSSDAGAAPPSATPPVSDEKHPLCPKCVKIFNGKTFDGWEAAPSTWSIVEGAMRGIGGSSRAVYTKADYGNVRLIVSSRMNPVNGDHLGILFWGDRPMDPNKPKIDNAGWVQWMPPFGGMWSYHPPMHHGLRAMKIATSPAKNTEWHTTELLLNLDKGSLRAAVNGLETSRYTHEWPTERMDPTKRIIKGPLAFMRHGGGGSEYKDVWVEVDPEDKLVTVK
jgi:Domain of Unknown Function (DUF1080)